LPDLKITMTNVSVGL